MKDYIQLIKKEKEGSISVRFEIKHEKIAAIGEKLKEVNGGLAMNGANWEALLEWYLDEYYPNIAGGMGTNSVAGMYKAYYKLTPANEAKATQLADVLTEIVENDSKLYDLVKEHTEEIDWE